MLLGSGWPAQQPWAVTHETPVFFAVNITVKLSNTSDYRQGNIYLGVGATRQCLHHFNHPDILLEAQSYAGRTEFAPVAVCRTLTTWGNTMNTSGSIPICTAVRRANLCVAGKQGLHASCSLLML